MSGAHHFLQALAMVLCVAAVTSVLFQRLRQPVVLGYLMAGLIIGPHVAIPLVADPAVVQTLSELGVILLMFSLGLEFSLRKLVQVGPTAAVTALLETGLMLWLGFVVGRAFGWTTLESIFAGAVVAISSTTIIAKAFDERNVRGKLRDVVVGILLVEDLIAILLLAVLTAVASGAGLSAGALAATVGKLGAFLIGLVVVGLLVIPRAMRAIAALQRAETTLVASVGLCFAVALLALRFGYSVALGAFLAGSLIAESGKERIVEHLVRPVRDMFAAVFFVSVGMLLDPAVVVRHWDVILVLTGLVIAGKVVGVSLGAFFAGNGTRTAIQAGMSLAQIGEFSFIIASLGLSMKATGGFLFPVAVTVSALTTLTTPWFIRLSQPAAVFVDRVLPRPLQTFVALYGSWIENLRAGARGGAPGAALRRLVGLLVLDALLLVAVTIATSVWLPTVAAFLESRLGLDATAAQLGVIFAGIGLAMPFSIGILRVARRLGLELSERALPGTGAGRLDLAAAPRRALVVTLQLGAVLTVGIPAVAITQPFLPGPQGAMVLLPFLGVLGVGLWKSATNLQGHVRAGAQVIVEALAAQSKTPLGPEPTDELAEVRALLPGIGEPAPVRLAKASPAVGQSLALLNLRGLTGATVLAIRRGDQGLLVPTADEVLQVGDVLVLAGSHEAIDSARSLLLGAGPG